ncbi:hypothetical protein HNW77_01175 [Komagataeibacter sp. AV436]|uniref:Uncharacterized protein n=2 Tax=Komagataeibacter melomenusus TaxID=2766578 RepID=A0ABX2A9Q4_9PROT|nr:hypothetical protein [Komagataeibacter melomenusus]NPC65038.1 hypothetical protein [Komagataeibacter melomenusus]
MGKGCNPPLSLPWLSHIAFNGTCIDVLATGRLLLPQFMEYEGGVFPGREFDVAVSEPEDGHGPA